MQEFRKVEPAANRRQNSEDNERTSHHPRRFAQIWSLLLSRSIRAVEGVDHHPRHVDRSQKCSRNAEDVNDVQQRASGKSKQRRLSERRSLRVREGRSKDFFPGEESCEQRNAGNRE